MSDPIQKGASRYQSVMRMKRRTVVTDFLTLIEHVGRADSIVGFDLPMELEFSLLA